MYKKIKMRQLSIIALASTYLLLLGTSYAQSTQSCRGLAQINNDLWFLQINGSRISQLTTDGKLKYSAAASPDGKIIAYSGKVSGNDVTFLDNTGRLLGNIGVGAKDAITGLTWVGPGLLRTQEHVSPSMSIYRYVRVPSTSLASINVMPELTSEGVGCAISPDMKEKACFEGDTLSLNGKGIYYLTSPLNVSKEFETMKVAVGTSVSTSTSPSFRIEVKSIIGNVVHLILRGNTDAVTEKYVPFGEVAKIALSKDNNSNETVFWGVIPKVSNGNNGVATLSIVSANTGKSVVEGGLAWDPRGKRIAFVESVDAKRTLVIINRQMGSAAEAQGKGAIDLIESLPIAGPITSVSFPSETKIRVEGASEVYEKNIPPQGKVPAGESYTIKQALPKQLPIGTGAMTTTAIIHNWVCIQ